MASAVYVDGLLAQAKREKSVQQQDPLLTKEDRYQEIEEAHDQ